MCYGEAEPFVMQCQGPSAGSLWFSEESSGRAFLRASFLPMFLDTRLRRTPSYPVFLSTLLPLDPLACPYVSTFPTAPSGGSLSPEHAVEESTCWVK